MTEHQDRLLEGKLKQGLGVRRERNIFIIYFTDPRKPDELFAILKERGFNIKQATMELPRIIDKPLFSLEVDLSEGEAKDFSERIEAAKLPTLLVGDKFKGDATVIDFLQRRREEEIARN